MMDDGAWRCMCSKTTNHWLQRYYWLLVYNHTLQTPFPNPSYKHNHLSLYPLRSDKLMMRLSAGLSLALLGTATNIAFAFSLRPLPSTKFVNIDKKIDSLPKVGIVQYQFNQRQVIGRVRGGSKAADVSNIESNSSGNLGNNVASLWAAGGVVMILAKSIKRILPIALEPFGSGPPLSTFQIG